MLSSVTSRPPPPPKYWKVVDDRIIVIECDYELIADDDYYQFALPPSHPQIILIEAKRCSYKLLQIELNLNYTVCRGVARIF